MLRIENIDLAVLAEALLSTDELGYFYWIAPTTGFIGYWGDGVSFGDAAEEIHPEERGGVRIEAIPSRDAYKNMEEFTSTVEDLRIQAELFHALALKKPFRHFQDALHRHPEMPKQWHAFCDAAMEIRAIRWLQEHDLVEDADVEQALAKRGKGA